jgi:hypothetical protein
MEEIILTRGTQRSRSSEEKTRRAINFAMFVAAFLAVGILSNIIYATLIKQNRSSFFTLREVGIELTAAVTIGYFIFVHKWKKNKR